MKAEKRFSSPFRGFYLSTDEQKSFKSFGSVLVPFSGFLSFYSDRQRGKKTGRSSRPLFGVSIFLLVMKQQMLRDISFSSPFRGFYLSTQVKNDLKKFFVVLVPFSGFLSFYDKINFYTKGVQKFSSPFRGFYLSTVFHRSYNHNSLPPVLVPFSGFLSFYEARKYNDLLVNVLVPFSGFLSFYYRRERAGDQEEFSSPFRGFYLSTRYGL